MSPNLATPWNYKVQNLPPPKYGRVQNLPPLNSQKFRTLLFQGMASSEFWVIFYWFCQIFARAVFVFVAVAAWNDTNLVALITTCDTREHGVWCWTRLDITGNGWNCMNGWKWLDMNGVAVSCWKWLVVALNGWISCKWLFFSLISSCH